MLLKMKINIILLSILFLFCSQNKFPTNKKIINDFKKYVLPKLNVKEYSKIEYIGPLSTDKTDEEHIKLKLILKNKEEKEIILIYKKENNKQIFKKFKIIGNK